MTVTEIQRTEDGRVVPLNEQIERLPDETPEAWTDRLLQLAQEAGTRRQCSIGWHLECSDPKGESCRCACHPWPEQVQSAPMVMGQRESPMGWEPGEGWVDIPETVEVYLDPLRDLVKAARALARESHDVELIDSLVDALDAEGLEDE